MFNCARGETELFYEVVKINRIPPNPLDFYPNKPIIGRNHQPMNTSLFSLSIIIVVLAVLIIKDQFSVGMATVKVK